MTQSSANSLVLAMTQSGKSLMNSRNKRGPRTVPCGRPLTTGTLSETAPQYCIDLFTGNKMKIYLLVDREFLSYFSPEHTHFNPEQGAYFACLPSVIIALITRW